MSNPCSNEVCTAGTDDETRSLNGNMMTGVGSEFNTPKAPFTFEEVARQKKAVTDPLTKHLERVYDPKKDLRQKKLRRSERSNIPVEGSSRASEGRSDIVTDLFFELLTRVSSNCFARKLTLLIS